MHVKTQVVFKHMRPSRYLKNLVEKEVVRLNKLGVDFTHCRVGIDSVVHNQNTGYRVHAMLNIPGHEFFSELETVPAIGKSRLPYTIRNVFQDLKHRISRTRSIEVDKKRHRTAAKDVTYEQE